MLSGTAIATERLLNSTTQLPQISDSRANHAVAGLPNGGFVSVWQSLAQDGSGWGVYGQTFDGSGIRVGTEFRINQQTRLSQHAPSVDVSADGRLAVTWQSFNQDGSLSSVIARIYNANGSAATDAFPVNQTTRGIQGNADVSFLKNGNLVITWQGRGNGDEFGVFARVFSSAGTAVTDEFGVSEFTKGLQCDPAIAGDSTGGFWIAWSGRGSGDLMAVYSRRFAADGTALGGQIRVNQATRHWQNRPTIAASDDGRVLIGWQSQRQDGSTLGVYARLYHADGSARGDEFRVNETTNMFQYRPHLDFTSDGGFAVTWMGRGTGDRWGVFLREYNANGIAETGERLVNVTTKGLQSRPSIAGTQAGFVVMWSGQGQGDRMGVFASVYQKQPSAVFDLMPIPNQIIDEGQLLTVTPSLLAGSSTANAFTVVGSLPSDALFNPSTGRIEWTPGEVQGPGSYSVTVTAHGSAGQSDSETFTITVNEVNQPPVLASIGSQSVVAGATLTFAATATDVDIPTNTLIYSISGDVPAATLDPNTGVFTWNSLVTDTPGELTVTVTVNDQQGGTDSEIFTITLQPPADSSITLAEGDRFATELNRTLILPNKTSAVRLTFQAPEFDTTAHQAIRDAFEIELTDTAGNPLSFPYTSNRDAAYNWSEDLEPTFGVGTLATTNPAGQDSTVTINLSGMPAGTEVIVTARLVNNDSDSGTVVRIHAIETVGANGAAPEGFTPNASVSGTLPPVELNRFADITSSFVASYGHTALVGDDTELATELVITNQSNQTVNGRILVAIDNFSEPDANVLQPDGFLQDGRPYFELTSNMTDGVLEPGFSLSSREIRFRNLSGQRFSYHLSVFGMVNAAPSGFLSVPLDSIEAGKVYRYQAAASDPESDALSYSVVVGPETLTIDALSGEVMWPTQLSDAGNSTVILRATDIHGLSVDQKVTIKVLQSQANRPPVFNSTPGTEATAASAFEVLTLATGDSPTGLAAGDFGSGNTSLVAINAGDQSLSYLHGLGANKFAAHETVSVGEPRPSDALIRSGVEVSLGLPTYVSPTYDQNFLDGFATADFNNDGILDTAAIARTRYRNSAFNDIYDRFLVVNLGNGDGTFGAPTRFAFPGFTQITNGSAMLAMDFDGDGITDLLALDTQQYTGYLSSLIFYKGLGDGIFATATKVDSVTPVYAMQSADFNGDGKLDLLVEKAQQDGFGIQPGNGDGTFGNYTEITTLPSGGFSIFAFSFGDLDGDGDLDVVVGDWGRSKLSVFLNDGDATFSAGPELLSQLPLGNQALSGNPSAVVVGDFTGDGNADIAYATYNSGIVGGGIGLYVGDGSGSQFSYSEAQSDRIPYRPLSSGVNATPVDIDKDGDLDLLFVSRGGSANISQGIVVGLNDGAGHFAATSYVDAGGGNAQPNYAANNSATIGSIPGDFNRDGMLDILSAESNTAFGHDFSRLSVLLADRPGAFRTATAVPLENAAFGSLSFLMAGDFNNDGITDLWGPKYQAESITKMGNGDGTFEAGITATPYIGNEQLAPGFVADLNNDGNQDVVWIGGGGVQGGPRPRYIAALGNGDGTFQISFTQNAETRSIEPGDFNHDGFVDFAARGNSEFVIMLNDPAQPGTFTQSTRILLDPTGEDSPAMTVNDFDGDGKLDVVVVLTDSNKPPHRMKFFHGNGDGTLSVPATTTILADTDLLYPKWMSSADLNHDGYMDFVVTASYSRSAVFLGNNDGTFREPTVYLSGTYFASNRNLLLSDVDHDGNTDMINIDDNPGFGRLTIRRGAGDGTFGTEQGYDNIAGYSSLASADFDNDGRMDFVLVNSNYGESVVYLGSRPGLADVVTTDINGDGNLDVLAINNDNSHVKRLLGNGSRGLTRQSDLIVGSGPVALATGDFNLDGNVDFVTANRSGRSLSVMLADGSGSYTRSDIPLDAIPLDVRIADLNGDGKLDLSVIDAFHHSLQFISGNGNGTFQPPQTTPLGDQPGTLTLSDTDSDGQLDAVITLPQSSRVMILPGHGNGTFAAPQYVVTNSAAQAVAATDFNEDGIVDLAVTLPDEDQVAVLFGIGSNRFAEPQNIHVGAQPDSLVLQDVNHDGRQDILVTNSGDATASVILNKFDPTKVYRYQAVAIDPDSDPISYTLVSGPGGMIFDAATGDVRWAPSADQVGLQQVVLQARDGRGGVATQQFAISVEPAQSNAAPVFTSQANATIPADEAFSYNATAVDNDNDTVRYRIISGPTDATIDPTTGEVQWDPRGGALRMNEAANSSGVQIPSSASLDVSSFTLEGWFTFDATGNQILIWKDAPNQYPADGASYALRYQFGTLQAVIGDGTGSGEVVLNYGWAPVIDTPFHIASTFDAATGSLKLLINGGVVAELTTDKRIANFEMPLYLGFKDFDPFRGTMSQVRIWDVAHSAEVIRAGMDRAFVATTPNLIADYRFLEGDTQSVIDASGHQSHGKFFGAGRSERIAGIAPVSTAHFRIIAEDGKGGSDEQSFQVTVVSQLRGSIAGTVFNDINRDGIQQPGDSTLGSWTVYLDANDNGYLDASESRTTTDVNGHYRFRNLIATDYTQRLQRRAGFGDVALPVEVVSQQEATTNIPVLSQPPGQLRGSVVDDHAIAAAHMQVFADLDRDGFLDAGEPVTRTDELGQFALTNLEAGSYSIRINSRSGWTTTSPASAEYDAVLATDQTLSNLNFVVAPQNDLSRIQPVIISTPDTSAQARVAYGDFVFAYDPGGSAIAYSLAVAPSGMVIDPATGYIVWTPAAGQIGSQRVIVRAMNATGGVALQDFAIEVAPSNTVPIVTSLPTNPIAAGKGFNYTIQAQDAEQSSLEYTMLSGPVGATVDLSSGVVSWTPSAASVGAHDFLIEVSDGMGGVAQQAFTLTVQSESIATMPFLIHSPRSDASLLSRYLSRVDGVDATGQRLTTELLSGPPGLTLDANGLIQWMPTVAQLGPQVVAVRWHSPTGSTEDRQFTIAVEQFVGNTNPAIESTPQTLATVDQLYSYDVLAQDRDHDALAFELITAPAGMSISPAAGTIRWLPAHDQLGVASVTIRVSDAQGGSATQTFALNTRAVGGPPGITSVPATQAVVGQGYLYSVVATDGEHDPLQFALLEAPVGMIINARTGEIAWNPTAGQIGQQSVIISVSDITGGASTQGFAIQVLSGAPNVPPVISSDPVLFATVDQAYVYELSATDPEGTTLTYALRRNPDGMQIDSTTGRISWTPASTQSGRVIVTVVATDAAGGAALQSYELDVLAANHGPAFVSSPPTSVYAGATFQYDLVARDVDLDPLRYEIVSDAPSGMTIDSIGRIRWTTSTADIGSRSVQVRVTDPRSGIATQTINLQVIADNVAPKVTVLPTPGGWPWDGPIVVFVSAVDNVGVTDIELKVNDRIVPLDARRMARLHADDWGFGVLNMVATARDAAGNVGSGSGVSFYRNPDVDYEANPAVPTAIVTSPTVDGSVAGMVRIEGTAGGPDFKEYRLSYARADQANFTEFAHSTGEITGGLLGTWDTTLLENDAYVIRLEVTDVIGSTSVVDVPVGLSGALKLGNFRLSFEDMRIPVAGIPITIVRTYDTLRADRDSDFGYGWRLEYRNTDLRTSLPESGHEDIGIYTPFRPGVRVFLTLPGGQRQGFTFTPDFKVLPGFGNNNNLVIAIPGFTADAGVTSTLSVRGGNLIANEFGELYASGGIPWNPASADFGSGYTLTTADGTRYAIDGTTGLMTSAADRNGNSVTFTDSGISSSSGVVVTFERDARDRILSVTDPQGNSLRYGYDADGNLVSVTNREGDATQFGYSAGRPHYLDKVIDPLGRTGIRTEYNSEGRLIRWINADGQAVETTYDPDNQLVTLTDPLGHATSYEYDPRGNIVTQIDPLGGIVQTTYNDLDLPLTVTDPLGRVTLYTYDSHGNETSRTDPAGHTFHMTYGPLATPTSWVDPLGNAFTARFDTFGNVLGARSPLGDELSVDYAVGRVPSSMTLAGYGTVHASFVNDLPTVIVDATGTRLEFTYDPNGQMTEASSSVTSPSGTEVYKWSVTRDKNGKVISDTTPSGNTARKEYDAAGNLTADLDQLGRRTDYQYDALNRLIRTRFPDTTTEERRYDSAGRLIAVIDQAGRETRYENDALGRVTATIFPDATPLDLSDNLRTATEYDAAGQIIAEIDELGRRTNYQYDLAGNLIAVTNALGGIERFSYDANGLITVIVDPLGNTTTVDRDALGRPVATHFADGSASMESYGARGEVLSLTNGAGETTRYEYDSLLRLTAVIDPLGHRTSYAYDEPGRHVQTTDALNRVTKFEYDLDSRLIARVLPTGERESFDYDAVGQLIAKTDLNNVTVQYQYDVMGRLTHEIHPLGTSVVTTYTPTGQRATVTDSRGVTQFVYDERERLLGRTEPDGRGIQYIYDAVGNVAQFQSPAGTIAYQYDALDRPTTVTDYEGLTTVYEFDAASTLIRVSHPNGVVETRAVDPLGRATNIETTGPSGTIERLTYTFDLAGRRISVTDLSGRHVAYSYDGNGRLVRESVSDAVQGNRDTQFTYDPVGNRIKRDDSIDGTTSYAYDIRDRLLRETTGSNQINYTYDANGNLVLKDAGPADRQVFTWDSANRLIRVEIMTSTGTVRIDYKYDADGNRVARIADGVEVRFLVDSNRPYAQVIEEYGANGVLHGTHVFGPGALGQLSQTVNGVKSFFHANYLGTTTLVTDRLGVVTERIQYDAFGQVVYRQGPSSVEFLFAGEQRDSATGLDYLRARYYDASVGRFISHDPLFGELGAPLSQHRYVYAGLDPVNSRDPSGELELAEILTTSAIIGTLSGLGVGFVFSRTNRSFGTGFAVGFVIGFTSTAGVLFFAPAAAAGSDLAVQGLAFKFATLTLTFDAVVSFYAFATYVFSPENLKVSGGTGKTPSGFPLEDVKHLSKGL